MNRSRSTGNETKIVDRDGRRIRIYHRADASRPGQQLRRQMALLGKRWCRGCADWLPLGDVDRRGLCRTHTNAEYRKLYAKDSRAIRARVHARKRNIEPLPLIGEENLLEKFEGRCAYCVKPATTFDHVIPVAHGGRTEPGNMVPACISCNSSKKDTPLFQWLDSRDSGEEHPALYDVLALGMYDQKLFGEVAA